MSSSGWQVVDTKQKKAEKQQQKNIERKKLQKQIEQERQKRKEEEERLSYSGWGPEAEEEKKKKKLLKGKEGTAGKAAKAKLPAPSSDGSSPFSAQTIYTALRAFEEDKERKVRQHRAAEEYKAKEHERAAQAEAEVKRKKEKERKKNKPKKPSISQLSAALSVDACKAYLQELTHKYPAKYDVQLMVLADFFESKFGKASLGPAKLLEEKTFARRLEIPYAYLDDKVAESLETWLHTVPSKVLVEFTQFLLNEIFSVEKSHKTSGIGLRMLLSAIARGFPDAVRGATEHTAFVQKYLGDSPASYTPKQPAVLPETTTLLRANFVPILVWYFGQTIEDHPALAFSLWVEFLQPFLFLSVPESISTLVFDYFNLLFTEFGKNVKGADTAATTLALNRLATYREAYSEAQLKKDPLNPIYSVIENALVWRNSPLVHNYLEVYLRRAASANKNTRDEALKKVTRALSVNKESFRTWDKLYPRYVSQSTHVILYLTEFWDRFVSAQDKNMIQASDVAEAVHNFLYTNDKIVEAHYRLTVRVTKSAKKATKVDQADVEASTAACKNLLNKTGAKVSPASGGSTVSGRSARSRAQQKGSSSSSASSSSSSGFLGTLVYLLLFVSLVAAIAVLYVRQSQPDTYERLLQSGLAYYHQGKVQADLWSADCATRARGLLAKAQNDLPALGQQLAAKAHELKAQLLAKFAAKP